MIQKIYALLVGIDKYHSESGVPNLSGCVNDIEAIEEYLRKRITTGGEWELVENSDIPWKLTNELATRQAIIDGFQKHLCRATSEDVVLFYYAGHGSYEQAPQAFREKDLDSQIETLVCYDSRTKQGRDLADKELSYLIEQVAKNNPHILIVLDCCHSGTATRDPKVVERQTGADRRVRELTEFIFTDEWLKRRLSNSYEAPRHVAIAACRSHQTAKEHKGEDGKRRGAFSYFFTKALQNTQGVLSYADLVQDVNALILSKVTDQSPQIEALAEDLKQTFLGGAAGERLNYFTLTYDTKVYGDWVIKGGALHGIRPATEGETIFAIFPQGTPKEQLSDISHAIARAVVTEVQPEVSKIEFITDYSQLSTEEPYWAVTISVPVPQLTVNFIGDDRGIELARKALTTVNEGEPSLFIREAESSEDANYELEAHQGQYWIKQKSDRKSIVAPIPTVPDTQGYTQQRAFQIIKRLEHVARWMNVLDLKTPPTSQIKPSDVELEVIVSTDGKANSSTQVSDLRGEYTFKNNKWTPPEVKLKVTNHSEQDIYFQIVELAGDYSINIPEFFTERGSIRLLKKSSDDTNLSSKTSDTLELVIPRAYLDSGVTEYNEIFKLIVSAKDFDASLLAQKGLDTPPPIDRSTRSAGLSGALNRLMDNVYSRQAQRRNADSIDNWMTKEVKLTLIKPLGGVEIKRSEPTTLQPGVVLHSNSSFEGKVELNSLPPNSRDENSNLLPPILIEDPILFQPFEFNTTRSGLSKLSVLEISGIQNHQSVTPENPIKIFVDKPLSSNEYVLPIAYDGEFFLPLGRAKAENGKTAITLERLPEPTINSRSLQGSIKILFQKFVTKTFGKEFSYPLLRIAELLPDGRVSYQEEKAAIAAKVTEAKKILLYIHGILGDTETAVKSAQQAKVTENGQQKTLRDRYDLVLAFDYENLNTTIEENAKLLKQRLEEVGLTDNHGKQLDIVAHSMGGLISRTFIEKEGGNKIVQHLVMLGTPNGGSPWPTVQDWAFAALGIGLNQLSSVAWPAAVVGGILKFMDSKIMTLDQMNPRSHFIQSIATNPDPNVRYTIIAGDRSVRPEALETPSGGQSSTIKRLMDKLFNSAQERIVNLVFFRQPNDIAVTLESIKSVSEHRSPKPRIISPDATCDHVTYFTTPSGLEALAKALSEEV
jgi:pimeloyl-ACP methyl ester carboxylesterase